MRKWAAIAITSIGIMAGIPVVQAASTEYNNKLISTVYSAETLTCIFFQLSGVTEANPAIPNGVWFAINKTDKESYALLLSARAADRPLKRVLVDGSVTCGSARAHVIEF